MLNSYTIYTDGSDFKKTTRRLGVGGVLLDGSGKLIGQFSEELDRNLILKYYGTSECSNPFAEMVAVKIALMRFAETIGNKKAMVTIKSDYRGVLEWVYTKNWKAKEPYIKQIRDEILEILNKSPWIVKFEWVKGHQSIMSTDSKYNNLVDKLSKGEL